MSNDDLEIENAIRAYVAYRATSGWEIVASRAIPIMKSVISNTYTQLDWETVDDLTADIVVNKLLPSLRSFDSSKAKFSTWIGRIALNHTRDWVQLKANRVTTHVGTLYDGAEIMDGPGETAPSFLTSDDVVTVQTLIPFHMPSEVVHEVGTVFVRHEGAMNDAAVQEIRYLLEEHSVKWRPLVPNIDEFAAFLFGMIRWCKLEDSDTPNLYTGSALYPLATPLGLVHHLFGREVAGVIAVLFGSSRVVMPSTARVVGLGRKQHQAFKDARRSSSS